MDPASAIGIAAGSTQLVEQVANVFLGLFRYCEKVKHAPKHFKELREEARLVHKVLEDLKSTLETISTTSPIPTALNNTDAVEEFAETIKQMETRVEIKDSQIIKRFIWPFTQKENEDYLSKLERYKTTFILALNTIQRSIISNCY